MMARPAFINLWNNYPTESQPCDGGWENQCAIRMSITLNAERSILVDGHTYSEPRCSHGHARGAESLANWLWRQHLGRPSIFTDAAKAKLQLNEKNGIIFQGLLYPQWRESRGRRPYRPVESRFHQDL